MLDWKKRSDSAGTERVDEKPMGRAPRGYWGGLLFSRAVGAVVGIYLVVTVVLGIWWSSEPPLFPVQQQAQAAAQSEGKQMVLGYTTVETLKTVASTLL